MEQEPGKADEPVPAAPQRDDVPTFAPETGLEAPLENGSPGLDPEPANQPTSQAWQEVPTFAAPSEPVPVDADPSEPALAGPGSEEPDAVASFASAAATEETAPPPPPAFEPESRFASETPSEPGPAAETTDWELPSELPREAEPTGAEIPPLVEVGADPGIHGYAVPVEAPATPAVVSAWGPPPPPWPPVVSPVTAGTTLGAAANGALPAVDMPLDGLQPVPEEPYVETGPNWMLAFVCLWAAGTALNEAWFKAVEVGLTPALIRNVTVMGYGVLGLGLVGFALDALVSSKKQSPAATILKALVPALLTLAGVILLVLSNDPGRRI